MLENTQNKSGQTERGNATIIALAAVLVIALGAGAYYSGIFGGKDASEAPAVEASAEQANTEASAEPSAGEAKPEDAAKTEEAKAEEPKADATSPDAPIQPGNPVVAKLNGKDITRVDVFNFIQNLSPQTRQMPIDQLFPLALEQVVNAELIGEKVAKTDLENDPTVKKELDVAKQQIVRGVFMQKEADKAMTDDLLKTAYEDYKKNFPKMEEAKARHILVKDEKEAQELITQIEGGADFAKLAKEHSIDATKENGGELNYFVKQDVVPEFADAVFSMSKGDVTKKPVKSDFGYHVIEVMDKRERQPATLEQAKPFLTTQLRQQVLNTIVQKWRDEAKLEVFDINGKAIEPSAGGDKPAAKTEEKPAQ